MAYRIANKRKNKRKSSAQYVSKRSWRKKIITSALLALFVFLVWAFFFSPWFVVRFVNVSGTKTIDSFALQQSIQQAIAGKYFYFIPKAKLFLVSPGNIATRLKTQYPLLLSVSVHREFPDKIEVEVEERMPLGIWCKRTVADSKYISGWDGLQSRLAELNNDSVVSCYDYDKNGTIFQPAPHTIGSLITKIYDYTPDAAGLNIGSQAMSPKQIDFLSAAQQSLESSFQLHTEVVLWGNLSEGAAFYVSDGWFVILDPNQDLHQQLAVMQSALSQSIGSNESSLAYIDLRIKNRAYYRYKNGL